MNTADYIIKNLEELGINEIFGVPGDYNFNILDSIQNNENIKWIGCTNELNAGYASDGYARIRGYGALVTTYGVGELSAINAIAGSYAENIPIVHIVGLPSSKNIENKALIHHNTQDTDYKAFLKAYENITAAAAFITRDNAKLEIDRIFKALVKERKPVYIALPSDIAKMEISDRYTDFNWTSDRDALEKVVQKIADKINDSEKPIIIADCLIKRFDAKIEFKEFISKSQIPVTNFVMGTNIVDFDNEQFLGGYAYEYSNPPAKKYIDESDCLISIGCIYSDLNSYGQHISKNLNDQIAIYGTYTYVEGKLYNNVKISEVLEHLTEIIEPKNIKINRPVWEYEHKPAYNNPVTSEYIYPRIQEFIKENDIVITETGTIPHAVSQIKFPHNVDIECQMLWGSIGWATPATMGACPAKPNSRVILLTGEGAHQMSAMEIGSILKLGLKPVILLINNNGYTTERMISNDFNAEYHNIAGMNYSKFARVFDGDVWATRVETEDDFDKALKVTQIMNKMCYIEIAADKTDSPTIIKKYLNSTKQKVDTTPITQHKKEVKNDFSLGNFSYETVVHQGIKEEE